jgi:hypothetical protein
LLFFGINRMEGITATTDPARKVWLIFAA